MLRIQWAWLVKSWGEIAWVASVKWRVRLGIVALRWAIFVFFAEGVVCDRDEEEGIKVSWSC